MAFTNEENTNKTKCTKHFIKIVHIKFRFLVGLAGFDIITSIRTLIYDCCGHEEDARHAYAIIVCNKIKTNLK